MNDCTVGQLCRFLEDIAPLHLQESYDNSGLLAGDPDWPVRGVLISLDATEEVVREAAALGCNMVISHHPVIFRGLKSLQPFHHVGRTVISAVKQDIALYAIHTNLDSLLVNGVSSRIAERLGMEGLKILNPKDASMTTGLGVVGHMPSPVSCTDLLTRVRTSFNCGVIRHSPLIDRPLHKIAVCGGSGAFLIHEALRQGADAYITADIKYHEFFEADGRMLLMDIGHYESEQFTTALLYELVTKNYSNFASHCTKMITNPVQYF